MKKVLLTKNFFLLCLLLLVTQMSFAGSWNGSTGTFDFSAYPDNFNFGDGGSVTTSWGSQTILADNTYNQTENRFAVQGNVGDSGARWYIHNGGLFNYQNGTRTFSILNLHQGDKVTVTWNTTSSAPNSNITFYSDGQASSQAAGATVSSGTEYTISKNGTLDLRVDKYIVISKVVIWKDPSTWTAYFTKTDCVAELIDLGFEEPELIVPDGANVQYEVSNTKLVSLGGEQGPGDLTLLNTGKCEIVAHVWYNGNYYRASYNLTIKADDATYEIDGDTYTLTGSGKLQERVVTGVPKMQMEFGENTDDVVNITIVRDLDGIEDPVATTIDVNGWRQVWANYENYRVVPHQGTFYTFKPQGSGLLTVRGYLNRGSAYIVDANNLAPVPSELTSQVGVAQSNWTGATGMVGWAGDQVTTNDGRTTALAERYQDNNNDGIYTTGEMISQEITGLMNGTYTVELYANACYTNIGNNGNSFSNGDQTIAYVFANDATTPVSAQNATTFGSNSGVYTLTAQVTNGTLKIGLGKNKIGTNWHSIQIKGLTLSNAASIQFTPIANITTGSGTQKLETTVEVIGGHTYYLYGNTPSTYNGSEWATYQLTSFTFSPNFRYDQKSIVLERGATSGSQDLSGVHSNVEYSYRLKGDITSVTQNSSNGYISNIQGDGGAIIVEATQRNNGVVTDYDYYVITVPYKNKVWNFHDTYPTDLDNSLDWGVNYEVRQYDTDTRALYYLNEPILTTQQALKGDNAYWIGETAGLVVDANSKSFGLRAETDNLGDWEAYQSVFGTTYDDETIDEARFNELKEDGAFVDRYLKEMLNYNKSDVHGTNIPAMDQGAVLIIPKLQKGTYVGIKTYRHSPNTGDFVHATNVTDLEGNTYDGTNMDFMVLNQSGVGTEGLLPRKYGWIVFKVAADGDVTFQVTDKGWTHIKKVMVAEKFYDIDEFYEATPDVTAFNSDMILAKEGAVNLESYNDVENQKSPTVFDYDGTSMQYTFGNNDNGCVVFQESWHYVKYYLEDIKGFGDYSYESNTQSGANSASMANKLKRADEPTISITEDGQLNVTGGHGSVVVVQKVMARNDNYWNFNDGADAFNYVVDINRTRIYIREPGNTTQTYPYTWDFTNIPGFTNSDNWADTDGDGTYSPTDEGKNGYVQNSELTTTGSGESGEDIDEFDGLGFLTSTDQNGVSADGLDNVGIKTGGDGDKGLVIGSQEETTIVVPDVPEGAIVYIRLTPNSDGNDDTETVIKGGTGDASADGYTSSALDPTNVNIDDSGQNTYEIPGDGGDVNITVKDVTIEGIAVTNIYKECKFWDTVNTHDDGSAIAGHENQYCYNSDSHDLAIKYPLTEYYTGTFMKAVYVTGTNKDESGKVFAGVEPIEITPSITTLNENGVTLDEDKNEGFGVLVWSIDYDVNHPLFVPAIHDVPDVTTNASNLLKGVYAATELPASTDDQYLYVFTNVFSYTNGSGSNVTASLPGFYKVNSSGTLKANRAYLPLAASAAPLANLTTVFITPDSGGLNSIEQIVTNGEIDVNGTFHTISGMEIQGMPSQRGIYIQNGKKVLVK